MYKVKNSIVKVFLVFLILTISASVILSGCSSSETAEVVEEEQLPAVEEDTAGESESEEASETTGEETADKEVLEMEITGNINILSGLEISGDIQDSRPLAVMVENSPDARPQTGLDKADILFEIEDEYGITRYISIYSSYDSDIVGPVRSTRQYYAEVARSFDPVYVFWGTYQQVYQTVEFLQLDYLTPLGDASGTTTVSANFVDGNGTDSMRDGTRSAPHNAYVYTPRMKELALENGYSLEGGQSPLRFKLDEVASERGDITDISIDFSSSQFVADFKYNKDENVYYKSVGGTEHVDRETGEQLKFNNLVVMISDHSAPIDEYGHIMVQTTGTGKAFFFIDGNIVEGTWERNTDYDPFVLKDNEGTPVLFNRGKTYMSLLRGIDRLSY